jgi:hypothetical protein
MGQAAPPPRDPIADALARARAARAAIRELDGALPGQPLAVTLRRDAETVLDPSALDAAAFAVGDRVLVASLDDPALPARLAALLGPGAPPPSPPWTGPVTFVCVSIGDDPIEAARHAHRRAWAGGRGPWLGLGRAGDLATVSTCHLVIDGYGHARITARIAELAPPGPAGAPPPPLPPLAPVPGAIPLGVAWRELPMPAPRALPLAYALGVILHRRLGRPVARFSSGSLHAMHGRSLRWMAVIGGASVWVARRTALRPMTRRFCLVRSLRIVVSRSVSAASRRLRQAAAVSYSVIRGGTIARSVAAFGIAPSSLKYPPLGRRCVFALPFM